MKKKLLITTESLQMGGIEKSLIALLNNLDSNVFDIDLLILEGGELLQEVPKHVNVKFIQDLVKINYKRNLFFRVFKSVSFKSLIKKYQKNLTTQYDISLAYYAINNYSDLIAAVNSRKKYIFCHHDFYRTYQTSDFKPLLKLRNNLIRRKFSYFDKIICVSEQCRKGLEQIYPEYKDKMEVIYNLLNVNEIQEKSTQMDTELAKASFNIISVSRLTKMKNLDKLIKIHMSLIERGKNVKTYIVGGGEEYYTLHKMKEENKLTQSVFLLGLQKNPYSLIKQADLYISLSDYESFGLTLLESAVLGIPFITVPNGGGEEIVQKIVSNDLGIVCLENEIIDTICHIIDGNIKFSNKSFDAKNYNKMILEQLMNLFNEK